MSDLRITQMPVDAPLTGAELLELVQNGLNVQTTVSALAAASSQFTLGGLPNGSFNGGLSNQFSWLTAQSAPSGGGTHAAVSNLTMNWMSGIQWTRILSNYSVQGPNTAASTLSQTVMQGLYVTGAAAHGNGGIFGNAGFFSTSLACQNPIIRQASGGMPIAGFTMVCYMSFQTAAPAGMSCFFGFSGNAGPLAEGTVVGNLINTIGMGMDSTDTNLQWIINNNSGSATKTDLGVTPASLLNHLLRLTITCDGLGNCALGLLDLESGATLNAAATYAASTAKLPAADKSLIPHWVIDNNAVATNCVFGIQWLNITLGLASL